MGALKGTMTLRRYLVRGDIPKDRGRLVKGIRAHALVPIDPKGDVERSHGWASIDDLHDLELGSEKVFFGEALALTLRVDSLKPPASLVKRLVEQGLRELGRKPNRAEKQAYKREVVRKLRGQIFPVVKGYDLVWLVDAGRALFFSHGKSMNELAIDLFFKSFGLELVPDGPGQAAKGTHPLPVALAPCPEMVLGFPGMPGRAPDGEDGDDMEVDDA